MALGRGGGGRLELIEVVHTTSTRRVWKAFDRDLRLVVSVTAEALLGRDGDQLLGELEPYLDLPESRTLAPVVDAHVTDDEIVLVSPWVEGVDLLTLLETSGTPGLPVTAVLEWLDELGDALRHLEAHGLRHGDIRPANVVLSSGRRIVVVGLGTGVLQDVPEGLSSRDVHGLAATAVALLTGSSPSVGAIRGTAAVSGAALQRALLPVLDGRAGVEVGVDQLLATLRHELNAALPAGVVTFLLTDIVGSTRGWEADAASMATKLAHHDLLMADVVETAGGRLLKARGEGDATFSVFTRASAGVLAAVEAQRRLRAETDLMVRMAVHTGEAELREADYFGRTVNRAARLRSIAPDGGIALSGATADLVVDVLPPGVRLLDRGNVVLKDLERPERVYELDCGVDGDGAPESTPAAAPMISGAAAATSPEPRPPIGGRDSRRPRRPVLVGAAAGLLLILGAVLALVVTVGGGSASGTGPAIGSTTVKRYAMTAPAPGHLDVLLLQSADLPPGMTLRRSVPFNNAKEACGQRSVDLDVPAVDKTAVAVQDPPGQATVTEDLRRYLDAPTATRAETLLNAAFDCPQVSIANSQGQSVVGTVTPPTPIARADGSSTSYRALSFNGYVLGLAITRHDDYTVVVQYGSFTLSDDALKHEVTDLMTKALQHLAP